MEYVFVHTHGSDIPVIDALGVATRNSAGRLYFAGTSDLADETYYTVYTEVTAPSLREAWRTVHRQFPVFPQLRVEENFPCWISPDGKIYRVKYCGHDAMARRLTVLHYGWVEGVDGWDAADYLLSYGWVRKEQWQECVFTGRTLTTKQIDVLFSFRDAILASPVEDPQYADYLLRFIQDKS